MADKKKSTEATVRNIRRKNRKKYSAEEKIRIVLDGLRGETSIALLVFRRKSVRFHAVLSRSQIVHITKY